MKKITLQGIHLTPRDRDAFAPAMVEPAPIYLNAADYDPVLQDHCGIRNVERLFPLAAVWRPGRRGFGRIL